MNRGHEPQQSAVRAVPVAHAGSAAVIARCSTQKQRPVPSGRISGGEALGLGLALSGFSVVMLGLATNLLAAGLLAFTIFFYAVVYSIWLKRLTPQNIVIGGAAGAFPPMIGWAAATGQVGLEAVLMFMLIFMWTPPHFWALALFMKSDYADAGVPMLTVTHGRKSTRAHIWWYTVALVPFAIGAGFTSIGGPVYLAVAVLLNAAFLRGAWKIWALHLTTSRANRRTLFPTRSARAPQTPEPLWLCLLISAPARCCTATT